MTIIEAVSLIDDRKHNTFTQEDKVAWLSRLDGMVKARILDTHQGDSVPFTPYSVSTDVETRLLVDAPFDGLYLHWLEMQIDYFSGDYGRYNNARALFLAAWEEFETHYHRTHRPKQDCRDFYREGLCAALN